MSGMFEVRESGIKHSPSLVSFTTPNKEAFVENFKSNFIYTVLSHPNPNELVFTLQNVDVSFANALRRIMIAEVPTVAIELVYIDNNTSITHDEVLSHRLGLIPLLIDPDTVDPFDSTDTTEDNTNDHNTVVFRLNVRCGSRPPTSSDVDSRIMEVPPSLDKGGEDAFARDVASKHQGRGKSELPNRPYTRHVYSRDLVWQPEGDQINRFKTEPKVVHGDILITKLRQNQCIDLTCHARKSNGKDHAKYSPVATASYRMKPCVQLNERVFDEDADRLAVLEPGVFRIVKVKGVRGRDREAVVENEFACTMSRNFMRDPVLAKAVSISRDPKHFVFSIETVGMISAVDVVLKALEVLSDKGKKLKGEITAVREGRERGESMEE